MCNTLWIKENLLIQTAIRFTCRNFCKGIWYKVYGAAGPYTDSNNYNSQHFQNFYN